ncbi:XrtA/PEP-CTERM system-associated ATPase [Alterisphingorhabdus coralli]|uniref:XrtA-associated ATPase n=1 Tax=Alterisphingorhabdus coralli TaxID=3071408 RepID=A0AA97F3T0_9SPHN|nr:XrtA/PEP-CTERM system-associated ATPase [Parasphingorhabdus sp. SCSIO 66989]WOE73781.1 XrtA-associated ATPase [Parasphingorhabdus sp. SCSIO 66989]
MYESYYGLDARPFQLTPDPQYYFDSRTHRKALSYLGYGLAQGEGFIVITGEVGAGKTTLVGHLMETIDRDRLHAAQIVTSQLSSEDLLRLTAEQFGVPSQGIEKAALLRALESHFQAEARAGRRCLLIVDEAQNLDRTALEQLRMLSNFQLGSQALLQIFLLGQPEFRDMLRSDPSVEQLRQRIIATHHLEGMHADEVRPYIAHRLARAGGDGRPTFSDAAIAEIAKATEGIPRSLNRLMSRILLMGAIEQVDHIDAALVEQVLADLAEDLPVTMTEPIEALQQPEVSEADADEQAEPMQVAQSVLQAASYAPEEALAANDATDADTATLEQQEVEAESELEQQQIEAESEPEQEAPEPVIDPAQYRAALDRVAALEARMVEQERSLRDLLIRLVRWVESEQPDNRRDAA